MLLFIDGFDHWGSDTAEAYANMSSGTYANVPSASFQYDFALSAFARTGLYSVRFCLQGAYGPFVCGGVRRVFGGEKTTVGLGYALYLEDLPDRDNLTTTLALIMDNTNTTQCSLSLWTTGQIAAYRGTPSDSRLLAVSDVPVIVADAWQHVEASFTIGDSDGAIEVRVNGETVLSVMNVDTQATAITTAAQVIYPCGLGSLGTSRIFGYFCDLFCWDNLTDNNNDFIGDKKVYTLWPNDDTSTSEWENYGASSPYNCINEHSQDGDNTYIAADWPGSSSVFTSDFEFEDLPAEVVSIAGVQTYIMSRKTDAGIATFQPSLLTTSYDTNGETHALTTEYTYYDDVFETNPDTGAAWTPEELNAAQLRIQRVL